MANKNGYAARISRVLPRDFMALAMPSILEASARVLEL
jgi:hypothetical protein